MTEPLLQASERRRAALETQTTAGTLAAPMGAAASP